MLGRFAWPAATVAIAAMVLGYLREPPPSSEARLERQSGETVLREMRALARLETMSLHVEKVLDVKDHQTRLHGLVEGDDALLYVAVGEVVLGVDLSKIADSDLRFDPATGVARIELVPPEILSTRLDETHSHVHTRSTDVFARRNEGLEAAARRDALAAFAAAGKDANAASAAKAAAEKVLRAMARGWGAKELVVTWKEPASELPLHGDALL